MTVYVSEHHGVANLYRQGGADSAPLASYSLSTVTPSTPPLLGANTDYVRVTADAGSYVSFTASTVSTATFLTATNAFRIPANSAPQRLAVPVGLSAVRIAAAST